LIAVVGELDPSSAWAETDADRFVAVDELAAVALADAGVEGERILIVGAIGERVFAEGRARGSRRAPCAVQLAGKVALVEVAGLGPELTGQLALQLSLLDTSDAITWLFDAAGDVEVAAVLRRQVPSLGLRAKLFGATADAAVLWRAADIVVARPRPEVISRVLLIGGKLVALVDDDRRGLREVGRGGSRRAGARSRPRACCCCHRRSTRRSRARCRRRSAMAVTTSPISSRRWPATSGGIIDERRVAAQGRDPGSPAGCERGPRRRWLRP